MDGWMDGWMDHSHVK